ncbi:uncharacterized protein [Venturia canescens]|uniref:uncharacterized protein n=1 Tax=Venturia canescens TaxID=32260 RepID=UPI001C9CD901|nr:uncharacterized protein LOC122407924 [Venturia canescens]
MEVYWNKLTLDKPPTTSWRCTTNDFDVKNFAKDIRRVMSDLTSQTVLGTEAALLSRLIYRMKSKLRNDKGLKNMEKVNRALLNYHRLSLDKEYQYLSSGIECEDLIIVLPSRQMLQYVLVRTQGFGKLMTRIEQVAQEAGKYFRSRIILGQAWNMSIVAYAVIGRIWLLSRYLTRKCCNWYNRIYQYHNELKMIGVPWLPANYAFPDDLQTWLNIPWVNEDSDKILVNEGLSNRIFDLIGHCTDTEEDVDFNSQNSENLDNLECSAIIQSPEVESAVEQHTLPGVELPNKINSPAVMPEEFGQRINRDRYVANIEKMITNPDFSAKSTIKDMTASEIVPAIRAKDTTKRKGNKKSKAKVTIPNNINTKKDVLKFISLESYPGLDKSRWKIVKKNVKKLLLKLAEYEKNSQTKKHDILFKRMIQCIREWTT